MRRVLASAALVLAIGGMLAFSVTAAYADGNGAQTFTQTFKNQTDQFVDFVPCRDYQATITITYNGVLHFTVNKAGDFWATGTMTGTATVVSIDPRKPSFTGHFTMWFGASNNKQNGVDHSTRTGLSPGADDACVREQSCSHVARM